MHWSRRAPHGAIVGVVLASLWATAVVARQGPVPVAGTARSAPAKNPSGSAKIRKAVDWAKLNPAYKGATFVNDRATCMTCHEETSTKYNHTIHAAALAYAPGAASGGDCESCHGPGSKHLASPNEKGRPQAAP